MSRVHRARPQLLQRLNDAKNLRCACRQVRRAALLDGDQTQRLGQDRWECAQGAHHPRPARTRRGSKSRTRSSKPYSSCVTSSKRTGTPPSSLLEPESNYARAICFGAPNRAHGPPLATTSPRARQLDPSIDQRDLDLDARPPFSRALHVQPASQRFDSHSAGLAAAGVTVEEAPQSADADLTRRLSKGSYERLTRLSTSVAPPWLDEMDHRAATRKCVDQLWRAGDPIRNAHAAPFGQLCPAPAAGLRDG